MLTEYTYTEREMEWIDIVERENHRKLGKWIGGETVEKEREEKENCKWSSR